MRVQEIADADDPYRRIHHSQVKEGRPTRAAFTDPELSVDLARLTTPEQRLTGHASHGLASITAGHARSLGQDVFHDPLETNPAQAIVKGKKTARIGKSLARSATWVLLPPNNPAVIPA